MLRSYKGHWDKSLNTREVMLVPRLSAVWIGYDVVIPVINWYCFPLFVPHLFIYVYLFIESKGPHGCGQNNEGPGPVPRRQGRLPELSVTSCRAHHCVQWLFCSTHEAEGKEVGPVAPWYSLLDAILPEESASLLLESRSGPLGKCRCHPTPIRQAEKAKGIQQQRNLWFLYCFHPSALNKDSPFF